MGTHRALFSFGASLAKQFMDLGMPQLILQIVYWVGDYVHAHLAAWVYQYGGWAAFIEFYEADNKNVA